MAERRIEHRFNCTVDTYWNKLFFDDEYNRGLFLETLHFEEYEVLSLEDTESEIRRVIRAIPKVGDVPGPLKKLLKNGAGYTERGVYEKGRGRYVVNVTPNSLPDKLTIKGVTKTEALEGGHCMRIYDATVIANIFGVGGMLEKRLLDDISKSYEKAAQFTNRWVAERGL